MRRRHKLALYAHAPHVGRVSSGRHHPIACAQSWAQCSKANACTCASAASACTLPSRPPSPLSSVRDPPPPRSSPWSRCCPCVSLTSCPACAGAAEEVRVRASNSRRHAPRRKDIESLLQQNAAVETMDGYRWQRRSPDACPPAYACPQRTRGGSRVVTCVGNTCACINGDQVREV